ncbi:MAG: RDD family protein [Litorimonas sp.]
MKLGLRRVLASMLDFWIFIHAIPFFLAMVLYAVLRLQSVDVEMVQLFFEEGSGVTFVAMAAAFAFWFFLKTMEQGQFRATPGKLLFRICVVGPRKGIAFRNAVKLAPVILWASTEYEMFGYSMHPILSLIFKGMGVGLFLFIVLELLIDDKGTFYDRKYGTKILLAPKW